jgi:hypothetical protein
MSMELGVGDSLISEDKIAEEAFCDNILVRWELHQGQDCLQNWLGRSDYSDGKLV